DIPCGMRIYNGGYGLTPDTFTWLTRYATPSSFDTLLLVHQDPNEQFAGNKNINAEIHEILGEFPEPTRSRMRKQILQDRDALKSQGTPQADENARHTLREFIVARCLNRNGFNLEYAEKLAEQTPDWYDE